MRIQLHLNAINRLNLLTWLNYGACIWIFRICICPTWLELLFHAKFCVGKECICLVLYLYAKEIWNAILFEIKLFGMSLVWERVYVNGKITLWIFYEILIDVCLVVDSPPCRIKCPHFWMCVVTLCSPFSLSPSFDVNSFSRAIVVLLCLSITVLLCSLYNCTNAMPTFDIIKNESLITMSSR